MNLPPLTTTKTVTKTVTTLNTPYVIIGTTIMLAAFAGTILIATTVGPRP